MGELRKPKCIWSLGLLSPAGLPWTPAAPETCPELSHACSPEQWDTFPAAIITYSARTREQGSQGNSRRVRRQGNEIPGLCRDAPAWHILWDLTEGSTINRFPSPVTPSGQPRGIKPCSPYPGCSSNLTVRGQRSDLHRRFFFPSLHGAGRLNRKTGVKKKIYPPPDVPPQRRREPTDTLEFHKQQYSSRSWKAGLDALRGAEPLRGCLCPWYLEPPRSNFPWGSPSAPLFPTSP